MNTNKTIKILAVLVAVGILVQPGQAYAWWGGYHDRDHDRGFHGYRHYPSHGSVVFSLSSGFASLTFGGGRYYFSDGVYYQRRHNSYIVVAPPRGIIISRPPAFYQPRVIRGVTYYTYDGIYYQYTPRGYVLVDDPTVLQSPPVVIQPTVVTAPAVSQPTGDNYTVNIPNANGGYTAVTIRRSGNGYVGPQGEFYNQFPSVEQLKVMYGK